MAVRFPKYGYRNVNAIIRASPLVCFAWIGSLLPRCAASQQPGAMANAGQEAGLRAQVCGADGGRALRHGTDAPPGGPENQAHRHRARLQHPRVSEGGK